MNAYDPITEAEVARVERRIKELGIGYLQTLPGEDPIRLILILKEIVIRRQVRQDAAKREG